MAALRGALAGAALETACGARWVAVVLVFGAARCAFLAGALVTGLVAGVTALAGAMSHRERNALVRKWRKNYKDKMTLEQYVMSLERGNNANSTKD